MINPENKFYPIYNVVSRNPIRFDITRSINEDEEADKTFQYGGDEPVQLEMKAQLTYIYRDNTAERSYIPESQRTIIENITGEKEISHILFSNKTTRNLSNKTNEETFVELSDDSEDNDAFFVDTNHDPNLNVREHSSITNIYKKKHKPNHMFSDNVKGVSFKFSNNNKTNHGLNFPSASTKKKKKIRNEDQGTLNKCTTKSDNLENTQHSTKMKFNPLRIKTIKNRGGNY